MAKITRVLAWAWLIIIGGLMIYPGGIECIACGSRLGTQILGVVSIALGVVGLIVNKEKMAG